MKGHAVEEALVCFCLFSSFIDLGVDLIGGLDPYIQHSDMAIS